MTRSTQCMIVACTLTLLSAFACAQVSRMEVEVTLRQALAGMAAYEGRHGGWGTAYTRDGTIMWGQYRPIPANWITVQPPATPGVARVFFKAARVLEDDLYLMYVRRARDALLAIQTPEGGFPHEDNPAKPIIGVGTFDDDVTTAALRFLIDWWQHTGAEEDRAAVIRVGEFILAAQHPCGGWPQAYPAAPGRYARHVTFNDGVTVNVIRALFELHEVTGEQRFFDAAVRGGECILHLQGGPGEAVWAQQYDEETLEPAWARKFEPPGYSAAESVGVCNVLIELYLATGEERFLEALPRAFEWYDEHQLPNGKWARLYEPGTQRPVYGRRDKAVRVYDFAGACDGYGWQGKWYPHAAKRAYERIEAVGREAYLEERNAPAPPAPIPAAEVRRICAALSPEGLWVDTPSARDLDEYKLHGVAEDIPMVQTSTFCRNALRLIAWLEQ